MDGFLNVYKERGFTSHDVVAKLRGILKQKKIGHTGTLDPEAEGVLPVCLGKATKVCELLADRDKTYRAVLLLGIETDTQDTTGTVLAEAPVAVSEEQVRETVMGFVGAYSQVPPMYSALKVNGKKLYELARQGKEVERAAREVMIHRIGIEEIALPRVTMTVTCSKGTYIRTLCHDIGKRLGCGGCMEKLLRTRAAGFSIEEAWTLSRIEALRDEGRAAEAVTPVDSLFLQYSAFTAKAETEKRLLNGNPMAPEELVPAEERRREAGEEPEQPESPVRIYGNGGLFAGIYEYDPETGQYRPKKLFFI